MQTLETNLINYVQITKKNRKPTYKKRLFDFEMMSDFNAHITSQNIMWQKTSTKRIVLTTRETKETKDC